MIVADLIEHLCSLPLTATVLVEHQVAFSRTLVPADRSHFRIREVLACDGGYVEAVPGKAGDQEALVVSGRSL